MSIKATTLFTVSTSWYQSNALFEQLGYANQGDAVLLLQDAVLAIHSAITLGSFVAKCKASTISVYALEEDCQLRGIDNKYPDIILVDYVVFVKLVNQHGKQVAW